MSVLIRFAPTSATTTEQYDKTVRRLQEAGDFPPDGMEYHGEGVTGHHMRCRSRGLAGATTSRCCRAGAPERDDRVGPVAIVAPRGRFIFGRSGDVRAGQPGLNIIGLDKMC